MNTFLKSRPKFFQPRTGTRGTGTVVHSIGGLPDQGAATAPNGAYAQTSPLGWIVRRHNHRPFSPLVLSVLNSQKRTPQAGRASSDGIDLRKAVLVGT